MWVCKTHLSAVDTSVLDPGDDEPLTGNVHTLGVGLLDGTVRVRQNVDDALHLGSLDLLGGSKRSAYMPSSFFLKKKFNSLDVVGGRAAAGPRHGIARWHNAPLNKGEWSVMGNV